MVRFINEVFVLQLTSQYIFEVMLSEDADGTPKEGKGPSQQNQRVLDSMRKQPTTLSDGPANEGSYAPRTIHNPRCSHELLKPEHVLFGIGEKKVESDTSTVILNDSPTGNHLSASVFSPKA